MGAAVGTVADGRVVGREVGDAVGAPVRAGPVRAAAVLTGALEAAWRGAASASAASASAGSGTGESGRPGTASSTETSKSGEPMSGSPSGSPRTDPKGLSSSQDSEGVQPKGANESAPAGLPPPGVPGRAEARMSSATSRRAIHARRSDEQPELVAMTGRRSGRVPASTMRWPTGVRGSWARTSSGSAAARVAGDIAPAWHGGTARSVALQEEPHRGPYRQGALRWASAVASRAGGFSTSPDPSDQIPPEGT